MTRETKNIFAAVAPFATWIGLQTLLPATAEAYALRAGATLIVLLLALRRIRATHAVPASRTSSVSLQLLSGLAGGLLVLALWTLPEFCPFYLKWFVWPIGSLPSVSADPSPYDPAVCGRTLTIAKLIGSAFVIAVVEELFFRSFLYRWLQNRDFASLPVSRFDLSAFMWTVFLFTLEHDRPLAAALCGVIYGFLAIRCGLLSAVTAHVTTNLLLGVCVIIGGKWEFW